MILFGEGFLTVLVYGAVASTLGGSAILAVLLIRDWKNGRLW